MHQTTLHKMRKSLSSADLLEMSYDLPEERDLSPPVYHIQNGVRATADQTNNQKNEGESHGFLPWVPAHILKKKNSAPNPFIGKIPNYAAVKTAPVREKGNDFTSFQANLASEVDEGVVQVPALDASAANVESWENNSHLQKQVSQDNLSRNCAVPDSTSTDFSSPSPSPNRIRIKDVFGQSFRKVNTPLRLLSSGDETQPLHSPYRFGAVKSTPTQMEIKQHVKPPLQIVNFPPDSDEKAHPVIRGGIRCCAPPSPPTVSGLGIRKVPGYGNNIFPVAASKPVVTHQSLIDPVWATPQVDPTPQPKVINMSEELGQIKFSKHSQTKLKAKPSPQHNKLGIPESILKDINSKRSEFLSLHRKIPYRKTGIRSLVEDSETSSKKDAGPTHHESSNRKSGTGVSLPILQNRTKLSKSPNHLPTTVSPKIDHSPVIERRKSEVSGFAKKLLHSRASNLVLSTTRPEDMQRGLPSPVCIVEGSVSVQVTSPPPRKMLGFLYREAIKREDY